MTEKVWQEREKSKRWDGKRVWAFGMMSASAILPREEPFNPLWWWGKGISAWTQQKGQNGLIWSKDRERRRRQRGNWDWQEKREIQATEQRASLKIFGGMSSVSVVLPADHDSWDCRGWKDCGHRIQNKHREFDTYTGSWELKTLERCQVLLFLGSCGGARLKGKKRKDTKYGTFVFVSSLFAAVKCRKVDGCWQVSAYCAQACVFVRKQRSTLTYFTILMPVLNKPGELKYWESPGGVQGLLFHFYELSFLCNLYQKVTLSWVSGKNVFGLAALQHVSCVHIRISYCFISSVWHLV